MSEVDVIVIGAGISGLTAARTLHKEGSTVLVLEARSEVGGRTMTQRHPKYGAVDLGGTYVGVTQYRLLKLLKEFDLKLCDVENKRRTVMSIGSSWQSYESIPFFWNPLVYLDINNVFRNLDSMSKEVPPSRPWEAKKAQYWDSLTVQQYLDKTCWTRIASKMVGFIVQGGYCVETNEMSLLYLLWGIRTSGGLDRMMGVAEGNQAWTVAGGTQQISEKLAEILGDAVHLNSPVSLIKQSEDGVRVTDGNGQSYKAKYVISTVPLPVLNRIRFEPSLPATKIKLIQNVPLGSIFKTFMFYDRALWKDMDMNGASVSDTGPVLTSLEYMKPDSTSPSLMGITTGSQALHLATLTFEERKKLVCEHYAKIFKNPKFLEPQDYVEKDWIAEQYITGGYGLTLKAGFLTQFGRHLISPVDRVHFAGSDISSQWPGYIEGGIYTGQKAAMEILAKLGKIDEVDDEDLPTDYGTSGIGWWLPSVTRVQQIFVGLSVWYATYLMQPYFTGWRGVLTRAYLDTWE